MLCVHRYIQYPYCNTRRGEAGSVGINGRYPLIGFHLRRPCPTLQGKEAYTAVPSCSVRQVREAMLGIGQVPTEEYAVGIRSMLGAGSPGLEPQRSAAHAVRRCRFAILPGLVLD